MAKMKAIMAAVLVMEKEGVAQAFGVPGAAINPLYAALRERGTIAHVLARHVEGASHMAEGYTRAKAGNIGVCIGTSGPAGTDMITGLYSASADSIPILCITGQAPRARLYKEDFQAVDIESIAKPVTKWVVTVREPAQVPRAFQQAFHLMRSGRPGPVLIDLKREASELNVADSINFMGYRSRKELPQIYHEHDVFVTASAMETQGLVALEAIATGLPAVGVDAFALPELIHHGQNGFVPAAHDVPAIAAALVKLLKDRAFFESASAASIEIAANHSHERSVDRLEKIYRKAIAG